VTSVAAEVQRLESAMSALSLRGHMSRLHECLTGAAGVRVDRAGYLVLRAVEAEGPLRLTDLATLMQVEPSTISRHAADLTARGWLEKQRDPDDRRACLLAVTESGREIVTGIESARRRVLRSVLSSWDAEEREKFVDLTERFVAGLAKEVVNG
jgi:DNA-binding MarR family transcriptional regulator